MTTYTRRQAVQVWKALFVTMVLIVLKMILYLYVFEITWPQLAGILVSTAAVSYAMKFMYPNYCRVCGSAKITSIPK